jgi:CheY-like chemotaxis protein
VQVFSVLSRTFSHGNTGKAEKTRVWRPLRWASKSVFSHRNRASVAHVSTRFNRLTPDEMSEPKPTILLVEDNEEDAFLLRRALRLANVECSLQVAEDGQQATEYLGGTGKYADRVAHPFPSLVLLDLKLPYVHGFEVLGWMSTQMACKDLRVIILTSSGEDSDRARAEQFGIRSYFTKPPTRDLVAAVVKALNEVGAPAK